MNIFFNAHHSPLGAHSSFTLGCKGKKGGLGLEMGAPACENVYIGLQNRHDKNYSALPFYEGGENESARYNHDKTDAAESKPVISSFNHEEITRRFKAGSDAWNAGDLTCSIFSTAAVAPDPDGSPEQEQMRAYCPAVVVELKIDNRNCAVERSAFFGYTAANSTDSMNIIRGLPEGFKGIAKGRNTAMITDSVNAEAAQNFSAENILTAKHHENYNFGLGDTGLLLFSVPAGQKISFKIAICFFRPGIVTSGEPASYWYSRFFDSIDDVGIFALNNFNQYRKNALDADRDFDAPHLNDAQRFQLAHSIRSYFGSTQLLDWNKKPFWVVNEGEYRMMNTFDLTVDQLFFEMRQNPWTVKNELDMFVKRYSYTDMLHFPGGENICPGGISFTHDMGRKNHISRPGHSAYEQFGVDGCFSHMTHEQLVNWILCASVYIKKSNDGSWLTEKKNIFEKCLESMLNRDNPDPRKRNGIMALDSSRTINGSEITTYDSLDKSLGQARNNVYIGVKCWAAYLALAEMLDGDLSLNARKQAGLAADTISSFLNENGFIPAIMEEGCDSKIIPAIEGLVFPYALGMNDALDEGGEYGRLIKSLKTHFENILVKGTCLYEDNGWKLSSSADNSWLSKIYLCQFVARRILKVVTPATGELADAAHQSWLLKPENLFFAWSDQMKSGVARGSKYYPRGVTSILWLEERILNSGHSDS